MSNKMRSDFEAWYEAWQMPSECSWFVIEADGDYFRPHTDTAWNAWQAALEHKPDSEAFKVGNLVTINQDEYPALGSLFVQLWDGASVAARVYGNDDAELNQRIEKLNTSPQQASEPAKCDECGKLQSEGFALYCVGCIDMIEGKEKAASKDCSQVLQTTNETSYTSAIDNHCTSHEFGIEPSSGIKMCVKCGLTYMLYKKQSEHKPEVSQFPERDINKPAEQQGMFRKFNIKRVDGSDKKGGKHHGCSYWVLDLDHDTHAPAAMRAYAVDCRNTHPELSKDLIARFGEPEVSQPTYDMSIHSNPDAQAWAKFFMETIKFKPDLVIDESLMLGWFANAMMAMHDHIKSEPAVSPSYAESIYMIELKAQLLRSENDNTRLQSQYDEMRLKCSRLPVVAENEALKLRVEELEAATEHLGLTPQQAKDGLARHKALVAERDDLKLRVAELEADLKTVRALTIERNELKERLGNFHDWKEFEVENVRLQSERDRLRDAAKQALLALHFHTGQTRPIDTSIYAMDALNDALKEQAK